MDTRTWSTTHSRTSADCPVAAVSPHVRRRWHSRCRGRSEVRLDTPSKRCEVMASLPICGEGIDMGGARRDVRAFGALLALGAVISGSIAVMAPAASAASSSVVISQVYTGGGNTGAPFLNDFVELHNNGSTTVDVTGW